MKIAYASDIHLEFSPITLENTQDADVLVLAGDICVGEQLLDPSGLDLDYRSTRIHTFFKDCSKKFNHIIYIRGNHESYHGDFPGILKHLKSKLGYIKNLHILEKDHIIIDDVIFVGGTMWTNMNDNDDNTHKCVSQLMNDFRIISNSNNMVEYLVPDYSEGSYDYHLKLQEPEHKPPMVKKYKPAKFTTRDAVNEFNETVDYIKKTIADNLGKEMVVITHHSPSYRNIPPEYKNEYQVEMNGGYHSDLDDLICGPNNIAVWINGHTHTRYASYIGRTLSTCNPRGYAGHDICAETFELRYIDLDFPPSKESLLADNYWQFHPKY